jgi:hypothetical protein
VPRPHRRVLRGLTRRLGGRRVGRGLAGGLGQPPVQPLAKLVVVVPALGAARARCKRRSTPGAGLRSLSAEVAVVGTRPDGALACRPEQASRG